MGANPAAGLPLAVRVALLIVGLALSVAGLALLVDALG
jgi:hypothetical protein